MQRVLKEMANPFLKNLLYFKTTMACQHSKRYVFYYLPNPKLIIMTCFFGANLMCHIGIGGVHVGN